eukprot:CAMPEP_0118855640 /NCGR_PEP_ID=MMETSP1163-20130328/3390_1 /TAXON_ID=124430 /ORGANISM="Phaeomonas parva, Strain CCMP2877" /LENGTH=1047 /DNA_ID=CAMNT_0006788557 /DNA_START=288 /DNA_END=3431 /DNA_ORIENTATION=+
MHRPASGAEARSSRKRRRPRSPSLTPRRWDVDAAGTGADLRCEDAEEEGGVRGVAAGPQAHNAHGDVHGAEVIGARPHRHSLQRHPRAAAAPDRRRRGRRRSGWLFRGKELLGAVALLLCALPGLPPAGAESHGWTSVLHSDAPVDCTSCYVINVGSVLELKDEADSNDGTLGASGDTCNLIGEKGNTYLRAVNALNGGRGFEVSAGGANPIYYRFSYTIVAFEKGEWETQGRPEAERLFRNVSFIMGQGAGCPDSVTQEQALIANETKTIYMTSRGPERILTERGYQPYFFSIHLNSNNYPFLGLRHYSLQGARTVAIVYEVLGNLFFTGLGTEAPRLAEQFGYDILYTSNFTYLSDGVTQDFGSLVSHLDAIAALQPDVIVLAFNNDAHRVAFDHLRTIRPQLSLKGIWAPQVPWSGSTCAGFGVNCTHAVGATQIGNEEADAQHDVVLDCSYEEYVNLTSLAEGNAYVATDVPSGFSAFIQSVQAVFRYRSLADPTTLFDDDEYELVVAHMASGIYIGDTFHGPVAFNQYGHNEGRNPSTLQTGEDGTSKAIFPSEYAEASYLYPAPGATPCPDGYETSFPPNTCVLCSPRCHKAEDKNYIPDVVLISIRTLVGIVVFASVAAIIWTKYNIGHSVIRQSQPEFLILIALGALISTSSIIPLSFDDRSEGADLACAMFPWFYCIGFNLSFHSLFAKVLRVKAIMDAVGMALTRVRVDLCYYFYRYLALPMLVEFALLMAYTMVDPMRYQRECDKFDEFGLCVSSYGRCVTSESGAIIGGCILLWHVISLIYGVYLCYRTRHMPSELNESSWISIALFSNLQIIVLAVPIIALISRDATTNSTQFVMLSMALWLNDSAILSMVFVPKIWRWWLYDPDTAPTKIISQRIRPDHHGKSGGASASPNASQLRFAWTNEFNTSGGNKTSSSNKGFGGETNGSNRSKAGSSKSSNAQGYQGVAPNQVAQGPPGIAGDAPYNPGRLSGYSSYSGNLQGALEEVEDESESKDAEVQGTYDVRTADLGTGKTWHGDDALAELGLDEQASQHEED